MTTNAIVGGLPARSPQDNRYLKRVLNRCAILFACDLFGYPVVGSITSLLQLDSRILSVPFRLAVASFSVWVILTTRPLKVDGLRRVMLVIWFLYVIRLVHDWLGPDLDGADYALEFFTATSLLPGFALLKGQVYEQRRFARIGFMIASAGALLGMFAGLFGGGDVQDAGSGRLSLSALNPVSLGNQATAAVLCGMVLWRDAKLSHRMFLSASFALLFGCLVLTGSKGPVLQLMFCLGLWGIRRGFAVRLGLLGLPVMALVLTSSVPLADRFAGTEDDSSTLDRVVMIKDSVDQIAGSPLIGSAFVELNSGFYPHNVFLEAGLAFGVPVALVFTGMFLVGARRAWASLKTDCDLLGLLYFAALLESAIAGSIYGMTQLWVTLVLLPAGAAFAVRSAARPLPPVAALPSVSG